MLSENRRLLLDAGVAGGIALWKAISYLGGGFYGIGTAFLATHFAAAFTVFCFTAYHLTKGSSDGC